ncbi:alpha/beta hydrolase [Nocardioides sp.]|uniref:alpha/beta fold hydrolase n=1 Tax=Nocardioides sp. TaxID=35761 RepID=UPI002D8087D8|nr:alpha/beta hydrolase [Nocardioides sp.]HET8960762.1 alpha/beta hydrolase [Nocardioides sp.]
MAIFEREGIHVGPDGRRVGWLLRGPEGGRVVGWLHGQPGSRRDARAFDASLERYGVSMLAIDRAGYGDTDPAGLDRRVVAGDLLAAADHLGVAELPVIGVSMGAVYALTLAALEPRRVTSVVLVSGHVLPYDDPEVEAHLSDAEREDLAMLRRGRPDELEADYAASVERASDVDGAVALLHELAATMSPRERDLLHGPFAPSLAESIVHGFSGGHVGYLEDGMRTIRPLEVDLEDVRCPVRLLHGTADDLEPYANAERVAARLADASLIAFPGLGHFGPWIWPDLPFAVLAGG